MLSRYIILERFYRRMSDDEFMQALDEYNRVVVYGYEAGYHVAHVIGHERQRRRFPLRAY